MEKKVQKSRKKLLGTVIKITDKTTAKVRVERKMTHPLYKKIVESHKRYLVNNTLEGVKVGDRVYIEEGRPLSKKKIFNILKKVK